VQKAADDASLFGQIMNATLAEAANGFGAMERAIEEEADLLGSKRLRSVELLAVLGAVGPMIGLFGTVYGMIVAFQQIVEMGGSPDPSDLAGGISTALITTFWGLIIGIPAVAAASMIRNKIDGLIVEAMIQAELLIGPLSPTGRKTAPGVSVPQVKA
jgi:biopolymer transport protein ExbB